ncbi:MAG: uroporphyrinogen-III synthase [Chloroflexi bacterium]|nr:uroporphyrinogen-III synthase [Chloroflexota bacterium]
MKLINKRILITRPKERAKEFTELLTAEGAKPIFFPVIQIFPLSDTSQLDDTLRSIANYDWLILTSIHAVEAIFNRLQILGLDFPNHIHVAAVGMQTSSSLSKYGIEVDFIPTIYTTEALADDLGADMSAKRVLLPQSNLSRDTLRMSLRSAGATVDEVIAYHTLKTQPEPQAIASLRSGVDIITFASPSSVHGFVDVLAENEIDIHDLPSNPLVACIGQVTASAVREVGLPVHIEAKEHTIRGLVTAMKEI